MGRDHKGNHIHSKSHGHVCWICPCHLQGPSSIRSGGWESGNACTLPTPGSKLEGPLEHVERQAGLLGDLATFGLSLTSLSGLDLHLFPPITSSTALLSYLWLQMCAQSNRREALGWAGLFWPGDRHPPEPGWPPVGLPLRALPKAQEVSPIQAQVPSGQHCSQAGSF